MRLQSYNITRFQFSRDRTIGDSQVKTDDVHVAALELMTDTGHTGLGFMQSLFTPLPTQAELDRVFNAEVWPTLSGQNPIALVHQVTRPRGGNQRNLGIPAHEALQVALWDLVAKSADMPLWKLLGAKRDRVRAYASGLDFHLSDAEFTEFFGEAAALGYPAFKIKVGHPDFQRDMHRIELLRKAVGPDGGIMIDANEAWGPKEAAIKIGKIQKAGFDLIWVEDPILRTDFEGLRMLRSACPNTLINSGEYLDASGKRQLMMANATDIVNVHGQITDVMRTGWLAADMGVPVSVGNTFLEVGIHPATALPEVEWIEYSFQNFDHLVDEPIQIEDGWALAPDRPGHGLVLSDNARKNWARPDILSADALGDAPPRKRPATTPKAGHAVRA